MAETEKKPARARAAKKEEAASPLTVGGYSPAGERAGDVQLPESIFGQEPNQAVMHQAYVRQVNNARQGTAKTKRRGEVSGGGAKPYRQKGTGRARHGSNREPSMVGGGTVFGPQPRSFAQDMPRKMRRLALRSALSVKASEGKVSVVESAELAEPRTRLAVELLRGVGVESTALVVLATPKQEFQRAFNNVPWAKVILARNLNLYDIFTHEHLVITRDSLELLEENFSA
jgi:large subunit ribosomal protein L4